jgi:hypothetical protein
MMRGKTFPYIFKRWRGALCCSASNYFMMQKYLSFHDAASLTFAHDRP